MPIQSSPDRSPCPHRAHRRHVALSVLILVGVMLSCGRSLARDAGHAATAPGVTLNTIPPQLNLIPFQIVVKVADANGAPVAGAHVRVRFAPGVRSSTVLLDGTGTRCSALEGTTDARGQAVLWVRLFDDNLPYSVTLRPEATLQGQNVVGPPGNMFLVHSFDTYTGP